MELKIDRHTISSVFLSFLTGAILTFWGGCSLVSEKDTGLCPSVNDYSVSFNIVAGNKSVTRAVDEYGTEEENVIDENNLKILIFDENQKLKQIVYDNGVMDKKTSIEKISTGFYVLRTKLDPNRYNLNSKFAIVALANWNQSDSKFSTDWNGISIDEYQVGKLSISDFKKSVFTLNPVVTDNQPDSWIPGKVSGWIPMFGSRYTSLAGYDRAIFSATNPMPIPDIDMVRAISKIEVINLDVDKNAPTIESVTLSHRNQKGRLMQDYVFTGFTSNVVETSLPSDSDYTNYSIPFHKNGNVYTIYIPEMELSDFQSRDAINIILDMNGIKNVKTIYLAPYGDDGLPIIKSNYDSDWDSIKRNYVYRFSINSLAFEFVVYVDKWKFGGKVHIPLE